MFCKIFVHNICYKPQKLLRVFWNSFWKNISHCLLLTNEHVFIRFYTPLALTIVVGIVFISYELDVVPTLNKEYK